MDNSYKRYYEESVTVKFKIVILINIICLPILVYWRTTTPWTLPANVALAVGKLEYVLVKSGSDYFILAKSS